MLNITNLTFSYPKQPKPVIDDLSIRIEAGGVYGPVSYTHLTLPTNSLV